MKYAIYARMGLDHEWHRLCTLNDKESAVLKQQYYQKTWRIVEIREHA